MVGIQIQYLQLRKHSTSAFYNARSLRPSHNQHLRKLTLKHPHNLWSCPGTQYD